MDVGEPLRVVEVEPVVDPIRREEEERVEEPVKLEPVPA
jgi:hypothetical protein